MKLTKTAKTIYGTPLLILILAVFTIPLASAALPSTDDVFVRLGFNGATDHDDAANASQGGSVENFNEVGTPADGQAGKLGTAWDFDGSTDGLTAASEYLNHSSKLSYCIWANIQDSATRWLVSLGGEGGSNLGGPSLSLQSTGKFKIYTNDGTGAQGDYANGSISFNEWAFLCVTWDGTDTTEAVHLYVNAVNITPDAPWIARINGANGANEGGEAIGCYHTTNCNSKFNGLLDEYVRFDKELTQAEITSLYNAGTGDEYPYTSSSPPTITLYGPTDNDHEKNTTLIFSAQIDEPDSGAATNVTLWLNISGTMTPVKKWYDVANTTAIHDFNYTDINETSYDWKIEATEEYDQTIEATNTTARALVIDRTNVTLETGVDNEASFANASVFNFHLRADRGDKVTLAIDANDTYMFAFNVTVIGDTSGKIYSNQTTGLGSDGFYSNNSLNLSQYPGQIFRVHVNASDDHTQSSIPDYQVNSQKSKITFKTPNDNNIKIETDAPSNITAEKLTDRYTFTMEFDDGLTTTRTFHVKTDKCMLWWRWFSDYQGHFVSSCDVDGNWVDFEGTGENPVVTKINDYHYTVKLDNVPPIATFNSIGGLNIINVELMNFLWSKTPVNPGSANTAEIASTVINLTWTAGTGANLYEVSNSSEAIANTTALTYNITGLTPGTSYTFYINSIYNDSDTAFYQNASTGATVLATTLSNTTVLIRFWNATGELGQTQTLVSELETEDTTYHFSWVTNSVNETQATTPTSATQSAQAGNQLCDGTNTCYVTLFFNDETNISGIQIYEFIHDYTSFTTDLYVIEDMDSEFKFKVTNEVGNPIPLALVTVYQYGLLVESNLTLRRESLLMGQRYTDADGEATFYFAPGEKYNYQIARAGYNTERDEFFSEEIINNSASPYVVQLERGSTFASEFNLVYVPQWWNNETTIDIWVHDYRSDSGYQYNTTLRATPDDFTQSRFGYWTGTLTQTIHMNPSTNFTVYLLDENGTELNDYNVTWVGDLITQTGQTNPLVELAAYRNTFLTPLLFIMLIIISIGVGSYVNTETGTAGFTTFLTGCIIISFIQPSLWYLGLIALAYFVGKIALGVTDG